MIKRFNEFINESTHDDFILNYGRDAKILIKQLSKLGKLADTDEKWDAWMVPLFNNLERIYDPETVSLIDTALDSRIELTDVVRTAITIQNKYGTETSMVISAMEDAVHGIQRNMSKNKIK